MRCCDRRRPIHNRSGFSLVEVLAGTILLATLVVGVLVAMGSHQHKIRFSRQKLTATQLADQLLDRWHTKGDTVPLASNGFLSADGSLGWQTQVVQTRLLCGVPVNVVRLNLLSLGQAQRPKSLGWIDVIVDATPIGTNQ